jgi:hypothetical protein
MIACDRLAESKALIAGMSLKSQNPTTTHFKATPFASAAFARANGRFCF